MRNITAVMNRELLSLFCSPIGYITIAGFWLVTGVLVLLTGVFSPGRPASLRDIFFFTPFVLTIIVPAISMRTLSEEYRTGTIETLMTAPISDAQMVLGKYLASLIFYVFMVAGTGVYLVLLEIFGNPDWAASLVAYFGLLLLGMFFMAFGMLASSLSRNQVVAWMLGAVPLLLFACFGYFLTDRVEGVYRQALQQINVMGRFNNFTLGVINFSGVVFFVAMTALFLFLAIKVVESRRWR